jgi:hypothetical protein
MNVDTLALPLTQWRLQWRDDGYWRALSPDQWEHVEAIDREDPLSWMAWTGIQWEGGVIADGTADGYRMLLGAYGEMPDDGSDVTVTGAYGEPLSLLHIGKMWACEWSQPRRWFAVSFKGEVLPVERPLPAS